MNTVASEFAGFVPVAEGEAILPAVGDEVVSSETVGVSLASEICGVEEGKLSLFFDLEVCKIMINTTIAIKEITNKISVTSNNKRVRLRGLVM